MQVPQLWEQIKFACVQADEINKEDISSYLNELLHSLLSDKAQCWLRFGDDRRLISLMITRMMADKITDRKILLIQVVYSWEKVGEKEWIDDFNFLKEFAKHEQCKRIYGESKNPRVWQLAEIFGFKENLRKFVFNLEV